MKKLDSLKRILLSIMLVMLFGATCVYSQLITFDDQGYIDQQTFSNPYLITNNGETFIFSVSNGGAPIATDHTYRTTDFGGCGGAAVSYIDAGPFAATTWTIETQSGDEIDLGTVRFDNTWWCFAFEYDLTIEGFKNGGSTGTQVFTTTGINSVWNSNANFDDVDKIVITCADLGNLGIDDINWVPVAPACTDPDVPIITATPGSIYAGGNSTLNISGNLNDATAWQIYTGSCGGTNIGNTASSTFIVSPGSTTTYYIRGEGGCVTPGSCGSVTVTVLPDPAIEFNYNDEETVVSGGESVYIAGDFNGWTPALLTVSSPGIYTYNTTLPLGTYSYKYVVNNGSDQWDWLNINNRSITITGDATQEDYRNVTVGWANLSFPGSTSITLGGTTENIYGQIYVQNVTNPAGEGRGLKAQVGYGTDADPANWTNWEDMTFNTDIGNNDEFSGTLTPSSSGSFKYAIRYDGNWGISNPNKAWTFADLDGAPYSDAQAGVLTVNEVSPPGSALDFDDNNDYVNVPTNPIFETTEFSAEAWINTTAASSNSIISCFDMVNGDGWNLSLLDNKIFVNLCKSTGSWTTITTQETIVNDGRWHHVAFTLDNANNAAIYLDGVAIYSGTGVILGTYVPPASNALLIGRNYISAAAYFGGKIDEVRVWSYARTENDIKENMDSIIDPGSANLVAYYRFDHDPGETILTDLTSNNNNGTLTNMDPATDWVESYAMVYPSIQPTTAVVCDGMTLNWDANRVGIAENYYLEVASDAGFTVPVTGYDPYKDMGTLLSETLSGLTPGKYFYRIRAYKSSTGDVGAIIGKDSVQTDIIDPTITCPGNQVGNVDGSCNFSLPDYTALATAADNCTASPIVTQSPIPGTIVGTGTTNIVLTATDEASNTANCNFDVVVSDATNPTIACPGNQTGNVDGSCNFSLPDYTALATAGDNCPGVTVTQVPAPGTIVGTGTTNILLTATDASSNTANCNFDVVVSDATNPTIACPGNQTGNVDGSCNFSLPDYTALATAGDNCPGVTVTQVPAPGTIVGTGTTNIVLTATDGASNTANCNFDVVVSDITNPTITCPGNQIENPDASCNFTLPDYTGLVTATDNCNPSPTVTQSPIPGTVISGTTTITMTGNDGNGNTAQCMFDVMLNDVTPPTAVCQNINVYLDGAGNATIVAADLDGGSTDNCSGITLSASQTAFNCADLGPNTVTLTATDGNSNTANCVAVVTVIDTVSPTVTCPGNQTETPDASCNFTLPDYTGLVTAADNCGSATVTQLPIPGTIITGTTTITMTGNDGNGNTAQCTFDVVLNDATPPTAVCQNINVYLDGAGNANIVAEDIDGGSTDNCSGLTLSASQTAFTCADLGPNNVTLTATDGSFNTANCVAVVTVIDTISPVINCQPDVVICENYNVFSYPFPIGTDNCSGGSINQTAGLASGSTFPLGVTVNTFEMIDGSGNSATCSFSVTVNPISVTNLSETICAGDSLFLEGAWQKTPGTYTDTYTAANLCDSIIETVLTVNPSYPMIPPMSLFISEYIEGSSNNKGLELYNPTADPIDLSEIEVHRFSNGGVIGAIQTLSGMLASQTTYNICNTSAVAGLSGIADLTTTWANWNGDDAILVINVVTGDTLDIFGTIGEDPGTFWSSATNSTVNQTLVRNANVFAGVMNNPGAGFPTLEAEWTMYAVDDFTNYGTHAMTPPTISPVVAEICGNDSIFLEGAWQHMAGTYYDTIPTINGCDSIIETQLDVFPSYVTIDNINICEGDLYNWQGTDYTAGGTYNADFVAITGCDSTFTLNLTVNTIPTANASADFTTICEGDFAQLTGITPPTTPVTAIIGTDSNVGDDQFYPAPYGNYYWGAKHQILILASELNAEGIFAGPITEMSLDVATTNGADIHEGFAISIGHTTLSDLTSDFETGLVPVFGPVDYMPVDGLNTHVFQAPFIWNGADNIIIETCFNNSGYNVNASTYYTTTAFNSVVHSEEDNSTVCSNPTGSTDTNRPNIRLVQNGPYAVLWTPAAGLNSDIINDPVANPTVTTNYIFNVTDVATGCSNSDTVLITVNPALVTDLGSDTAACHGNAIVFDAGVFDSYLWHDGSTDQFYTTSMTEQVSVTVFDAAGCYGMDTVEVYNPLTIQTSITATPTTGFGWNDGAIDLEITDPLQVSDYLWFGPGAFTASTQDLVDIFAGWYFVEITDTCGNVTLDSAEVTQPDYCTDNLYTDGGCLWTDDIGTFQFADISNSTMFDECPGGASGYADYTYMSTDVIPGNSYNVSVGTSNPDYDQGFGVWIDYNFNHVFEASEFVFQSQGMATAPTVFNGTVIIPSDAQPGITRIRVRGFYEYIPTADDACLVADYGEIEDYTIEILDCNNLAANVGAIDDVSCFGAADGNAYLNVSGGTLPITFQWDNGATTQNLMNVGGGQYIVEVTDGIGCITTDTADILEPLEILIGATTTNANCGLSDGAATLTIIDGVSPYLEDWGGENPLALAAGTYTVLVTDANFCTATSNVIINNDLGPVVSVSTTDAICFGDNSGTATSTITMGTPPYNVTWGAVDTNALAAGVYSILVIDASGCETTESYEIFEAAPIEIDPIISNVSCFGGNDGAVTLNTYGGTSPYTEDWGSEDPMMLSAGMYTVIVTDALDCSQQFDIEVLEPTPMWLEFDVTDVTCNGESDGFIDMTVNEGTPAYLYNWSNFDNSEDQEFVTAGWYYVIVTDAAGCEIFDSVEVMQPDPTDLFQDIAICVGDSVLLEGMWQTTTGIYIDQFTAANGCDSTVTTNLIVDPAIVNYIPVNICEGDSIFAEDAWQFVTGIYYDTLYAAFGCDSIVETDLTVSPVYLVPETAGICDGDSIFLAGDWQFINGTYTDVLISEAGCDSIIETTLEVYPSYEEFLSVEICEGDSALIYGTYEDVAGLYYDNQISMDGCDSIIITELIVNPVQMTDEVIMLCDGDSIDIGGTWYYSSEMIVDTLTSSTFCDSIHTIYLSISSVVENHWGEFICSGDSILLFGEWQFAEGVYTDTIMAAQGCDSVLYAHLIVGTEYLVNEVAEICEGDSLFIGGNWQVMPGTYYDSYFTVDGCDSIIETELIVHPLFEANEMIEICDGDSYFAGGDDQTLPGLYYDTLMTINGCDSVIITDLIVLPTDLEADEIQLCNGDSIFMNGSWQYSDGVFTEFYTNQFGCDSVVQVQLSFVSGIFEYQYVEICSGDTYYAGGADQTTAGLYYDTLVAVAGCDSIVETELMVIDYPVIDLSATAIDTICHNEFVELDAGTADWYLWSDGSTGQFLMVDSASLGIGTHTIFVTSGNGLCEESDTVTITIEICGGIIIATNQNISMNVYPNPANELFNLEINGLEEEAIIEMYDLTGKVIWKENAKDASNLHIEIDVTTMPKGIYYLRVISNEFIKVKKVVVQ